MKSPLKVLVLLLLLGSCTSNEQSSEAQKVNKSKANKSFDYQPESPVDGELMASIEIGSLGLNYFIISIDKEDRWKTIQSQFGRSNLIFKESDLSQILSKIEAFKEEIENKGVETSNIYVVASSSSLKLINNEKLQDEIEGLGLKLTFVSAKEEANYSFIASVPKEFIEESFLVDIGSGNTKLSWINGTDTVSLNSFGSKYYLDGTPDSAVFRTFRETLLKIPVKNRNLCFMIGGSPFEFAKHTDKRVGRYTILQSPSLYPNKDDRWRAGGVIYKALFLEPTYSHIFDWDANFSIGYLTTIN